MTPEQWIAEKAKEKGIKVCWVAEQMDMDAKKLSATLTGRRKFTVFEFLRACEALKLDPKEYDSGGTANA